MTTIEKIELAIRRAMAKISIYDPKSIKEALDLVADELAHLANEERSKNKD